MSLPFSQDASSDNEYASVLDCDALLLASGDPGAEDEPMKKGTCFQVSVLLYDSFGTLREIGADA